MQLYMTIDGSGDAIEMNALVRAVPACNVAKIAANALLLVDVRDDFVIEIQVLPLVTFGKESPRKSSIDPNPFERIQLSRPSVMSSTMR